LRDLLDKTSCVWFVFIPLIQIFLPVLGYFFSKAPADTKKTILTEWDSIWRRWCLM